MLEKLWWLIAAHYFGDVVFQTDFQSKNKTKYPEILLSHCIVYTACISIALVYLNMFSLWKVLFLIGGHFLIDTWKGTQHKVPDNYKMIIIDQGLHFLQLIGVLII